jgi:hypothetical protein
VRAALGALPWVEYDSIVTDIPRREVRFNLKPTAAPHAAAVFNEAELRAALARQRLGQCTVKSAPT